MDLSRPATVVASRVDAAVLQALSRTSAPLTGREVARLARGVSQPAAQDSLNRLRRHGVVLGVPAGRAILYTLNRDHVAFPPLEALLSVRTELIARVRSTVEQWSVLPVHLSFFGSMVRADGDVDSDIDLLMVRPRNIDLEHLEWRRSVATLERDIQRWSGNRAAIVELSLDDLEEMQRKRARLLVDVRRDGMLVLGKDISDIYATTLKVS